MQPTFSDSSVEIMSTERNEGQERWQPGGSSRVPAGPARSEAELENKRFCKSHGLAGQSIKLPC